MSGTLVGRGRFGLIGKITLKTQTYWLIIFIAGRDRLIVVYYWNALNQPIIFDLRENDDDLNDCNAQIYVIDSSDIIFDLNDCNP